MVLLVLCLCRAVPAADAPPGSPTAISPAQQQRLDAMKAKGPNASLTILPVMIAGRPFDQASAVLGVCLEQNGLQTIEIGKTPFKAGIKAELPVLSAALAEFLKTNAVATDYALYTEFNGGSLDEMRAVLVSKAGDLVWTDHQTTQDPAFQKLGSPRDPMTLIAFLVERLSPQLSLNEETAKQRKHTLEDAFNAGRGLPPQSEFSERMPARVKALKGLQGKATLLVLGVRIDRAVNVTNATDLAKRISQARLFQSVVPARQPVLLEAKITGGDQQKYLWALAREFQAYVKKNPPDADYVLYADYLFNREHWQQGGVQLIVCDRQGDWVIADLANSDHADYQRIQPISAEGCDALLVERLAGCLR
jgi:hypothetical protein